MIPLPAAVTPDLALPRTFKRLAWANLAAQSAEQVSLAAVPIVAVLALGAGPGEIGTLAAVQTLPFLLLSIPLGLLADRKSRRKLMVWAEVLRTVALLVLFAATWSSQLSIPLLACVGFIGAIGTVGFSVAAPSLVPALAAAGWSPESAFYLVDETPANRRIDGTTPCPDYARGWSQR